MVRGVTVDIVERWREYFEKLLGTGNETMTIKRQDLQTTQNEDQDGVITLDEIITAIKKLIIKSRKSCRNRWHKTKDGKIYD